jgi:capping protein alpha
VLITADGEVAPGEFLEPASGQVVSFDHERQVVTATRAATPEELASGEAEAVRQAVQQHLQAYMAVYAPNGHSAVFARGGVVVVCISSALFNLKNFWTGRLRSRWTVTLAPGGAQLAGALQADVHYFEDGNVQLAARHDATARAPAGEGADATGAAVVAALRAAEDDYFGGLESSFEGMERAALKELRRALPVTRQKFAWEQVQHKLAIELASRKQS